MYMNLYAFCREAKKKMPRGPLTTFTGKKKKIAERPADYSKREVMPERRKYFPREKKVNPRQCIGAEYIVSSKFELI